MRPGETLAWPRLCFANILIRDYSAGRGYVQPGSPKLPIPRYHLRRDEIVSYVPIPDGGVPNPVTGQASAFRRTPDTSSGPPA